jgi:hypothetical protein
MSLSDVSRASNKIIDPKTIIEEKQRLHEEIYDKLHDSKLPR